MPARAHGSRRRSVGALVATIGYAPFFVALGLGDLVGAGLTWSLVRPALAERRASAQLAGAARA